MIRAACLLMALYALPAIALAEPSVTLDIGAGERLLVLAPHPDDETLGAAGIVQRVLFQGGHVHIAIATAGDGYVEAVRRDYHTSNPTAADYLNYGSMRLAEANRAALALGGGAVRLDLLGFPDGGLMPLLSTHWSRAYPEKSPTTGVDAVPYPGIKLSRQAYDGDDLSAELLRLLRETRPTLIAMPDPRDDHPDHAALGRFALIAMHRWKAGSAREFETGKAVRQPRLIAYLVHWGKQWPDGPRAGASESLGASPLHLPLDLPQRGYRQACFSLNARELAIKHLALAQYATQQRAMGAFLAAFERATECFSVLTPKDAKDFMTSLSSEANRSVAFLNWSLND